MVFKVGEEHRHHRSAAREMQRYVSGEEAPGYAATAVDQPEGAERIEDGLWLHMGGRSAGREGWY